MEADRGRRARAERVAHPGSRGMVALAALVVGIAAIAIPGVLARAPSGALLGASAAPRPAAPPACAADARGELFVAGTVRERVDALRTWAAEHPDGEASLVLTDGVLTEAARDEAGREGAPVRDLALAVHDDGIHVDATVSAAFLLTPIRARLVPSVVAGEAAVAVRDLDTGSLPGFLRGQVLDALRRAADPSVWDLPLTVEDVAAHDGCVVVRGIAR